MADTFDSKLDHLRQIFGVTRVVVISGIIYLASQTAIIVLLHPVGVGNFLALQVGFSKSLYLDLFHEWRTTGIMHRYMIHLFVDMIHPVWYIIFLTSALALVMNAGMIASKLNSFLVLPLIAGVGDWLENIIQFVFVFGPNDQWITDAWVKISSVASCVKWGTAAFCLYLLVFLVTKRAIKSIQGKRYEEA